MRANRCHFCPGWVTATWLTLGLLALLTLPGCRRGVPVVDLGPRPPAEKPTISGIVRAADGTSPLPGRTVEVINTATGETHTAQTGTDGGFALEVPPGTYRLALQLHDRETLATQPGIVDPGHAGNDAPIEFVVSKSRGRRSRAAGYRVDDGLGSPMA